MLSYFNGSEWNYKLRSKNKQQEYDDIGLLVNNNFIEPPDDVVEEIKEVLLRSTLQDIQINEQFTNIKNIMERNTFYERKKL